MAEDSGKFCCFVFWHQTAAGYTTQITRMSVIRNPVMLISHMLITAAFGRLLENMRVCVGYISPSQDASHLNPPKFTFLLQN